MSAIATMLLVAGPALPEYIVCMRECPESPDKSWPMLLAKVAIVFGTCSVANDARTVFAGDPKSPTAETVPAASLSHEKLRGLIDALKSRSFQAREAALQELLRHTDNPMVLRQLLDVVDAGDDADAEQRMRAKLLTDPVVSRAIAKYRVRKDLQEHPILSYIPEGTVLPPGLRQLIGPRDGFDTRLFFRKLPGAKSVDPLEEWHGEFVRGTAK